jgi:hypothetical protein
MHSGGNGGAEAAIGFGLYTRQQGTGYFEPSAATQLLPGCKTCGSKHPLAHKPIPLITDVCPKCGTPSEPPGPVYCEPAVLTGYHPVSLLAKACLAMGKALNQLANKI